MQNQAKEWLSRIKDKVRYYDIQASVKSKKKIKKKKRTLSWHPRTLEYVQRAKPNNLQRNRMNCDKNLNHSSKFTKAWEMPIHLELPEQITGEILVSWSQDVKHIKL